MNENSRNVLRDAVALMSLNSANSITINTTEGEFLVEITVSKIEDANDE